MTSKVNINVCLTDEIRLEQALKDAGIDDPATVKKLTVSGQLIEADFRYIGEKMRELRLLDMEGAPLLYDYYYFKAYEALAGCKNLTIIP